MPEKGAEKIVFILAIGLLFIALSSSQSSAALNVSLSDQGTNVTNKTSGELLAAGNLSVTIYDAATGGTLIYSENLTGGITNGAWNVMLGENSSNPLPLEYGRTYYKDYAIDGEDVNFTNLSGDTIARQFFVSPLGDIADEDISNTTNLTLGERITFALGGIIENIVSGWIGISASLNVTQNISVHNGSVLISNHSVAIGTSNPQKFFDLVGGGAIFNLSGSDNIVIDGDSNLRNITVGVMRFLHKPITTGTRAITFAIDMNGFGDTRAMTVDYKGNGLDDGEQAVALSIDLDRTNTTGGQMHGVHVSSTGTDSADVIALHALTGVQPLLHDSGTFGSAEIAFLFDDSASAFTNVTNAFASATQDVTIFEEVDDIVYIGDSQNFSEASFSLNATAQRGIRPRFEYSNSSTTWREFSPTDNTDEMTSSGTISWHIADLSGWTTATVNGEDKQWIRITRRRNNVGTLPIEDLVQISDTAHFYWGQQGDLRVRNATITSLPTASPNGTTGRAVCIDGLGALWIDDDGVIDCA